MQYYQIQLHFLALTQRYVLKKETVIDNRCAVHKGEGEPAHV